MRMSCNHNQKYDKQPPGLVVTKDQCGTTTTRSQYANSKEEQTTKWITPCFMPLFPRSCAEGGCFGCGILVVIACTREVWRTMKYRHSLLFKSSSSYIDIVCIMIGFVASILVNEVAELRMEVGAITSALPSPLADDNDDDDDDDMMMMMVWTQHRQL